MPKLKKTATYKSFTNQSFPEQPVTNKREKQVIKLIIPFLVSIVLLTATVSLVVLSIVEMNTWNIVAAVFMIILLLVLQTAAIYDWLKRNKETRSTLHE
jgi:membrane protein YdbS with pleckstrin-like domain